MIAEALDDAADSSLSFDKSPYLDFPCLSNDHVGDEKPLNKYSSVVTKNHDFPGAQVGRLHA